MDGQSARVAGRAAPSLGLAVLPREGCPSSPVSACVHSPATGSSGAAAREAARPGASARASGCGALTRAPAIHAHREIGQRPGQRAVLHSVEPRPREEQALSRDLPAHRGAALDDQGTPGSGGLGAWKGARASGACRWRPGLWTSWPGDRNPEAREAEPCWFISAAATAAAQGRAAPGPPGLREEPVATSLSWVVPPLTEPADALPLWRPQRKGGPSWPLAGHAGCG